MRSYSYSAMFGDHTCALNIGLHDCGNVDPTYWHTRLFQSTNRALAGMAQMRGVHKTNRQ